MIGFLFFFFGVLTCIGMCALGAWSDFKGYRIPNIVSVVIVFAFVISYSVTLLMGQADVAFMPWKSHLASFFIVLMVTMVMFGLKIIGAGDSKMMAAVSLWLGFSGLVPFLFYMSVTGGLLGVGSLLLRKYKPVKNPPANSWIDRAQQGGGDVPYGIAIAVGTVMAFLFVGYFSPDKFAAIINM